MALPPEIKTTYAGYNYQVELNNRSGYNWALQSQNKFVQKYSTITPFNQQVFQDLINDILEDVEYNVSNLFPKHKLNNVSYPNYLKTLYQIMTRIGQDFEAYATVAGYQQKMTFLQLFQLLFPSVQIDLSDANPDNPE